MIQDGSASAYEACLAGLFDSTGTGTSAGGKDCVAGVAVLGIQGSVLYQKRVDPKLPCAEGGGLLSGTEGQRLVAAVKGLSEDGLCQSGGLSCSGIWYRVFGGTPLGIYAVGPGRHLGMIVRVLPSVGYYLVVLYRRPHLAQQVVPHVEKFIDEFCDRQGD